MKKNYIAAIIVIVIAVAALVSGLYLQSAGDESFVATLNGEGLHFDEYLIYLREQKLAFEAAGGPDIWDTDFDGVSAANVAKQNALDSLVYVKVMAGYAAQNGVKLSEEENGECSRDANAMYEYFTQEEKSIIPLEALNGVMGENMLLNKLYTTTVASYNVFEPEDFAEYYNANKRERLTILVQDIHIPGAYDAAYSLLTQMLEEMTEGALFEQLQEQFGGDDAVLFSETPTDLNTYAIDDFFYDMVAEAGVGPVAEAVPAEDGFWLFYVTETNIADMVAFKEEIREEYIALKQKETFDNQFSRLLQNADVAKNSQVWDSITIDIGHNKI